MRLLNKNKNVEQFSLIKDPAYVFLDKASDVAESFGMQVVIPKENELFIDIDTVEQRNTLYKRLDDISYIENNSLFYRINIVKETSSRSGPPHYHVVLACYNENNEPVTLTDWQRVALQFCLGSDPIKETLTVYRILAEVTPSSILFEE